MSIICPCLPTVIAVCTPCGRMPSDLFGTRLEKRFTREEMRSMMEEAGLESIVFSDSVFWCAVGYVHV